MLLKFEDSSELAPIQWRYTRQRIAELRPGWALEYIDQLSNQDVGDIFAIQSARAKAQEKPKE